MPKVFFNNFLLKTAALVAAGLFLGVVYVAADWQAPFAEPPTCAPDDPGCDPPLNVSGLAQSKLGGLIVADAVGVNPGFLVLNGSVGIGTPSPGAKLEVSNTDLALPSIVVGNPGNSKAIFSNLPSFYVGIVPDGDPAVGDWMELSGALGVNTQSPITPGQWCALCVLKPTKITNFPFGTVSIAARSSGIITSGFGHGIEFLIGDADTDLQTVASIKALWGGADNTGALNFFTRNAGTWNNPLTLHPDGQATFQGILELRNGTRLNPASSKPPCTAASGNRGLLWFTQGAAGFKDILEVCAKAATGVDAWRILW